MIYSWLQSVWVCIRGFLFIHECESYVDSSHFCVWRTILHYNTRRRNILGVLICSILTKKFQKFREINREVIHDHESANIIFVILAGKKRIESATDFLFFLAKHCRNLKFPLYTCCKSCAKQGRNTAVNRLPQKCSSIGSSSYFHSEFPFS